MSQIEVKVTEKHQEAQDICVFELAPVDANEKLPPFAAGAHIDVQVGNGLTRQYSLCNPQEGANSYVIAVLKEPSSRGGSRAMHETIRAGDTLRISEPRNHFPLAHDAKRSVLFAGGIGITPILCMAERLAMTGADFELHYCSRARERTAFVDRILQSSLASRVRFHFDDGSDAQKLDLQQTIGAVSEGTHLYVCGPGGFMDWVLTSAKSFGWNEHQLHKEYFSAAVEKNVQGDDVAFDVQVASTGQVFRVPPGRTVIAVLEENGIDVPVSCEQGVCGTCLTRVLQGEPDHRDLFMTDEERAANDQFTPCCSRSKSPCLVLDL